MKKLSIAPGLSLCRSAPPIDPFHPRLPYTCVLCDEPCSYGARWCRDCYVRVVSPLQNMDRRILRANRKAADLLARVPKTEPAR